MVIIGIDPGYAIVGYGIVEYVSGHFKVVHYGAITTPSDMPFAERLERIYDELMLLLSRFHPDAMAIEQLFFTNNKTTGIGVAQARGATILAAQKNGVPMYEYTPIQVKQSVVGYGKAVKTQVMEMTRVLLGLSTVPKPDDTADALAVAICHAHSSASSMRLERALGSTDGRKTTRTLADYYEQQYKQQQKRTVKRSAVQHQRKSDS